MGRIVVSEFISVDGVVEDPGGAESFEHGGWAFETERGADGDRFKLDETLQSEALLLGRVTYEAFALAWPKIENEFADKYNRMPKYVVSSTLTDATWTNTTVLHGDVADAVSELKQSVTGDMLVHGSVTLVRTLMAHDLVDELRLMTYPVVLGSGQQLFDDHSAKRRLRLTDSTTVGDGVAILTYVRSED